jgi:hypothetical protein
MPVAATSVMVGATTPLETTVGVADDAAASNAGVEDSAVAVKAPRTEDAVDVAAAEDTSTEPDTDTAGSDKADATAVAIPATTVSLVDALAAGGKDEDVMPMESLPPLVNPVDDASPVLCAPQAFTVDVTVTVATRTEVTVTWPDAESVSAATAVPVTLLLAADTVAELVGRTVGAVSILWFATVTDAKIEVAALPDAERLAEDARAALARSAAVEEATCVEIAATGMSIAEEARRLVVGEGDKMAEVVKGDSVCSWRLTV